MNGLIIIIQQIKKYEGRLALSAVMFRRRWQPRVASQSILAA